VADIVRQHGEECLEARRLVDQQHRRVLRAIALPQWRSAAISIAVRNATIGHLARSCRNRHVRSA
jgi:hypothetical protein